MKVIEGGEGKGRAEEEGKKEGGEMEVGKGRGEEEKSNVLYHM